MDFNAILKNIEMRGDFSQQNGGKTDKVEVKYKTDDLAVILATKENETATLFIALRLSKTLENWFYFCPTKGQARFFRYEFPNIYFENDYNNHSIYEMKGGNKHKCQV